MKRTILILVVMVLFAGLAAAQVEPIGRIKDVEGSSFITQNGRRAAARVGDAVYLNDVLETGLDGSMGVTFKDESRLSLGADTSITVDEFVYVPENNEASFLTKMTRGTLLFVSGLIAKSSPEAAKVETPEGTIGIRGTRFLVKVEERTAP
jgi:hypothetical protein